MRARRPTRARAALTTRRCRVMYWSVWAHLGGGAGSRIETARLDGSARRVAVAGRLHWPNGLALTADATQLYWCDTYLDKIERLELATGARVLVAEHSPATPVLKPYGLALYDGGCRPPPPAAPPAGLTRPSAQAR